MKKPVRPNGPGASRLGNVSRAQRQKIFREIIANAKKPSLRKAARPLLGQRGVSGPRGKLFREEMVRNIGVISRNEKSPNCEVAKKLDTILSRSRGGELFASDFPSEHQVLLNILNGVLAAEEGKEKKKFTPNPYQQRILDSWFGRAQQ